MERFGVASGKSENDYTKNTSFFEYDGLNRLTKVYTGGHATAYLYNGDGLRMSKNVDGALTYHVWDGSNMVMEMNGSGAATAKYIRGINLISGKDSAGTVQYYLFNGHGDVTSLTDSTGNVKKNYTYDAFGNEKNPDPNDTNMFRYTGEYFDKETGTIYLRARYYDPRMGRFVTEDSYRGSAGDPLSLNLYTYCGNDPVNAWDPSGHIASSKDRTIQFLLKHPKAAIQIGYTDPGKGKTDITNNSVRFSTNDLGLYENVEFEGSQVNAYRHALWQATITKKLGIKIAREIGYAHEEDPKAIFNIEDFSEIRFTTLSKADEVIDLLNNVEGRILGLEIDSKSMKDIAIATLNYYHTNGLWIAKQQDDGTYSVLQEKLSDDQYETAMERLINLDDNGFTDEQRKDVGK